LNSSPIFAAIISQLVMMSVLEQCLWQKQSAADKACSCRLFCLKDTLWMNNITRHYCLIDCDQQFAAVDQVCCRKVSFFKMAVPHRAIGLLDS